MNKLLLSTLKTKIDMRSSLLVLPSIDELLSIVSTVNPDMQRVELYSMALDKWHQQVPLIRMQHVDFGRRGMGNGFEDEGYKFESNWECIAKSECDAEVKLIPTRVISLGGMMNNRRSWILQDDILYGYHGNSSIVMNGVFRRPMFVEYVGPEQKLNPLSCIGGIEDRHISKFVDACLLETLFYVSQLKKNFDYPELPIQLFNGIDEAIGNLQQQLEIFYSGLTHGRMYR